MANGVYFGNLNKQTWIKAPLSGMKASNVGWSSETQLLNGRKHVRRSNGAARQFDASWVGGIKDENLATSLATIRDFSTGIYGDGPFYFLDPFAMNVNVMPPHWSMPALADNDWPKLSGEIEPTFSASTTANNYPYEYAQYVTTAAYYSDRELVLIIPTGYRLHFGWHGPSGNGTTGIRITPYKRSDGTADTALNPTKITAGGTVRTNAQISGTTYSHVKIALATAAAATVNISAMIAQILPEGAVVASGGFVAGVGTTGVEFNQHPTIEYYSSEINKGQSGMSATWIEV